MGKQKQTKTNQTYLELFYMSPGTVNARMIADAVKEPEGMELELWEEMNILEIKLLSGNHMDLEPVNANFKDPTDREFLEKYKIQTIYAVTICEEDLDVVKSYFGRIVSELGGFLCTDSPDFEPFYTAP